jgi:hypothetical protein
VFISIDKPAQVMQDVKTACHISDRQLLREVDTLFSNIAQCDLEPIFCGTAGHQ